MALQSVSMDWHLTTETLPPLLAAAPLAALLLASVACTGATDALYLPGPDADAEPPTYSVPIRRPSPDAGVEFMPDAMPADAAAPDAMPPDAAPPPPPPTPPTLMCTLDVSFFWEEPAWPPGGSPAYVEPMPAGAFMWAHPASAGLILDPSEVIYRVTHPMLWRSKAGRGVVQPGQTSGRPQTFQVDGDEVLAMSLPRGTVELTLQLGGWDWDNDTVQPIEAGAGRLETYGPGGALVHSIELAQYYPSAACSVRSSPQSCGRTVTLRADLLGVDELTHVRLVGTGADGNALASYTVWFPAAGPGEPCPNPLHQPGEGL